MFTVIVVPLNFLWLPGTPISVKRRGTVSRGLGERSSAERTIDRARHGGSRWKALGGGKMRRAKGLLLAGLCVLCSCQSIRADEDAPKLRELMASEGEGSAREGTEGSVGDIEYPVLVRKGMKRWLQAINSFWLALAYADIEEVTDRVMEKLWWHLFGTGHVQEEAWWKLRYSFRDYLREWWFTTPSVPAETLKTGVWEALSKLAAKDLSVLAGRTPKYEKIKELLHQKSLIDEWVDDIKWHLTGSGLKRWIQLKNYLKWGPTSWERLGPWEAMDEAWHSAGGGGDRGWLGEEEDDVKRLASLWQGLGARDTLGRDWHGTDGEGFLSGKWAGGPVWVPDAWKRSGLWGSEDK